MGMDASEMEDAAARGEMTNAKAQMTNEIQNPNDKNKKLKMQKYSINLAKCFFDI